MKCAKKEATYNLSVEIRPAAAGVRVRRRSKITTWWLSGAGRADTWRGFEPGSQDSRR
jgi:hypothetical protein